ncbi:Hypothetical_protein [Hexamita inflata]|uniref:Hypothetical_protein n=1 Tax=Hexamita inflata TaxID=28002 RepID=A0AA86N7V6_9EUKA|nr:Hypothetical protein HINF_LOCUS2259 [Hexamita inflata]
MYNDYIMYKMNNHVKNQVHIVMINPKQYWQKYLFEYDDEFELLEDNNKFLSRTIINGQVQWKSPVYSQTNKQFINLMFLEPVSLKNAKWSSVQRNQWGDGVQSDEPQKIQCMQYWDRKLAEAINMQRICKTYDYTKTRLKDVEE